MVWNDGITFKGSYQDDKITGVGEWNWPDGRKYYGSISPSWNSNESSDAVTNFLHGHCVEIMATGETFYGVYYVGSRSGYGIQVFNDDSIYMGEWYRNK